MVYILLKLKQNYILSVRLIDTILRVCIYAIDTIIEILRNYYICIDYNSKNEYTFINASERFLRKLYLIIKYIILYIIIVHFSRI